MHKLVYLFLITLFTGCIFNAHRVEYPAPVPPEGFALVDAYDVGRPEDYVKFHNATETEKLLAIVMFHNPVTRKWERYGMAKLNDINDVDTMHESSRVGGGLHCLRYFAVKFSDGKSRALRLDGAHNDLHIYVE